MPHDLAILGAGNMAEAIVRGVLRANLFTASQIIAADPSPDRRSLFQDQLHVHATDSNAQAAREANAILLSVKPQQMQAVLADLGNHLKPDTLIISIAAGVTSAKIEAGLGGSTNWRVVRTMPNTPMLVGEGMVGIAAGKHATPDDLARTKRIFESAAAVVEVSEDKINAVTALSGSGPAYFFFLVEHMTQAGIELGLTREQAHLLATKTASGAAKMMLTSPDSPQELRRKVTSPGGTTQAAIETMTSKGVPQAIVSALHRAAERGKELGG